MTTEFAERAALACRVPKDYGEGWMSGAARDMARIAAFAGFDVRELTIRLSRLRVKIVQERHVLAAMDQMYDEA